MAFGTFFLFNISKLKIANATIDLDSHAFKMALTTSIQALDATFQGASAGCRLADLTSQVANGGGYTTGGAAVTLSVTLSGGSVKVNCSDASWPASSITAKYAVLYDDTATNKDLVGFCDLNVGAGSVSTTAGNFVVGTGAGGLFNLSESSPSGAVSPPAAFLVDSEFASWSIIGGRVAKNGVADLSTSSVVLLLYFQGVIYQQNAPGGWWSWSGTAWIAEPRDPRTVALPTVIVTTLAELQAALANAANTDITLTAAIAAPSGGLNLPRRAAGLTLRCTGNGLLTRSSRNGVVMGSGYNFGGRITLVGWRIDGGWRTHKVEDSSCQNYLLSGYDYVRLDGCVSSWSLYTAFDVEKSVVVEVEDCVSYMAPRDHVWARGCNDLLVNRCLMQHCGDDGLGSHLLPGTGAVVRSQVYTNNILRDTNGFKLHAGSLDGTINGKPGRVYCANNTFEGCSLYAIHLEDHPGEVTAEPRNISFINNTVRELRRTTPFSPGQVIGNALMLRLTGWTYTNVNCGNNTFIRTSGADGQIMQNVFDWARFNSTLRPANVPGVNDYEGLFSKTANLPNQTLELANQDTSFSGNNTGAIVLTGNVWTGAWV